jgi:1-deoxy-D-xylulose-5-phosphate reductoisomerase
VPTVKRVAILGSTGSIGKSALAVVDRHPDRLAVVGLAAGENAAGLAEQVARYRPRVVSLANAEATDRLRELTSTGDVAVPATGRDGLVAVASHPDVDIVLCATSGTEALEAVLAAIEAGKTIALANKEVLVMAGGIITAAARRSGVPLLPVDSEHNAIHQCLRGRDSAGVARIILTASGGPFRGWTLPRLASVTPEEALRHPTWRMGRKITIDSATLMNKGLEVIEARWLFGLRPDQIEVLVHPQSVVHSMVELLDGSVIAQLGVTDMRLPIQYAFSYPDRWAAPMPPLDLVAAGHLEFARPDLAAFPCLGLAYRALESAPSLAVVLNAANEVAVALFLEERLSLLGIAQVIESAMNAHTPVDVETLADVREVDSRAREAARTMACRLESKV